MLIYVLYPSGRQRRHRQAHVTEDGSIVYTDAGADSEEKGSQWAASTWSSWASAISNIGDVDIRSRLADLVPGSLIPTWALLLPSYTRRLQRELSAAPGSVADEVWREARDPFTHPEIRWRASVRVGESLCAEEKEFLERRKRVTTAALARYLGLGPHEEVHPDDVPVIAVCGSGGGLRALVAGAGSLLASEEDGLWDCVTYAAGVSGSCWLLALYNSTLSDDGRISRIIDHLKARLGVHIAYPPAAFGAVLSAPTNKVLLAGIIEKLKGDPKAGYGLVDIYGILLASRLLVPKGELGVNEKDFKLSNQREYVRFGQNPLPIYTCVRHEIPDVNANANKRQGGPSEEAKEKAKKEAWFQWFELTPYEFFCEELSAGIPTWALGRKFRNGHDVLPSEAEQAARPSSAAASAGSGNGGSGGNGSNRNGCEYSLPETRMTTLLGIFGSAFCATLSHYYREIRPLIQSISGLQALDDMIRERNEDLSKVHPIDPGALPNFVYGMDDGRLPKTAPPSILRSEYLQLMDAGMSNNLPIYPLLRPQRGVEILIAFDASADVRTDNWLSVADGYARQRGIRGWPVGIGWPKKGSTPGQVAQQMEDAEASSNQEAHAKLEDAQLDQTARRIVAGTEKSTNGASNHGNDTTGAHQTDGKEAARPEDGKFRPGKEEDGELGYCTIWVGTTQERSGKPPPPSKALTFKTTSSSDSPDLDDPSWQVSSPTAGLAIIYLPFLSNPASPVPHVDPARSEFLSTWNFVYTPQQIEDVAALARANYAEGKEQIRRCVRAVYERKKRARLEEKRRRKEEKFRKRLRLGIAHRVGGEGDHFS